MADPNLDKRSLLDTLFPVNPLEVAGGLYGLGTQAAGNAASYAASHGPLDFLTPGGAAANPDTQSSASQFGGDVTAMLDSPAHGHVTPSAAAVPIVAAGAKLLPEVKAAETAATTVPEALAARATPPAPPPIVAYHGSPHSFDRFDISKIGTGEGAQAYGHGLYFAENENVARGYKSAGQPFYLGDDRRQAAQQVLEQAGGDKNAALALADQNMRGTTKYSEGKMWQDVVNNFDDLTARPPGSMYQVGINADPNSFLDWDKPLSLQSPDVQGKLADVLRWQKVPLKNNVGEETTGGQMMGYLENRFGNQVDAAGELSSSGVSGIRYLDQGSRTAGTGTNNYVLFDDSLASILKKYGLAGLGTAGGAAALTAGGQSPVSSPAEAAPTGASVASPFY